MTTPVPTIEEICAEFNKRIASLPKHYFPHVAVRTTTDTVYHGTLQGVSTVARSIHIDFSRGESIALGHEDLTAFEFLVEDFR